MARLPVLSGREVVRALARVGFVQVSQKGSHVRLKGVRGERMCVVIVPMSHAIPPGTLLSILRQAAMTREDLRRLL